MEARTAHTTVGIPLSVCPERVHTPRECFELTGAFRVGFQVGGAELPEGRSGLGSRSGPEGERGVLRRSAGRLSLALSFGTCSPGRVALPRD